MPFTKGMRAIITHEIPSKEFRDPVEAAPVLRLSQRSAGEGAWPNGKLHLRRRTLARQRDSRRCGDTRPAYFTDTLPGPVVTGQATVPGASRTSERRAVALGILVEHLLAVAAAEGHGPPGKLRAKLRGRGV